MDRSEAYSGRFEASRCSRELLLRGVSAVAAELLQLEEDARLPRRDLSGGESLAQAANLYGGALGRALFWAALARAPDPDLTAYAGRAERVLAPLRERLGRAQVEWEGGQVDVGGIYGLGSMVYALTCIGVWLRRTAFLEEALQVSRLLGPERIARDRRLDVVRGSAGALLALLALDQVLEDLNLDPGPAGSPRDRAHLCAEHLLARSRKVGGGLRAWPTEAGGQLCSGFAHGAAGIVYALVQLYDRESDFALLRAAREGVEFEHSLYRPELGDWSPFPDTGRSSSKMVAWCWGAPGIALGRLGLLPHLDGDRVRDDLRSALETTVGRRETAEDHLCCGNMGRLEILAEAGRSLAGRGIVDRPERYEEAAHLLVRRVLGRAKYRGTFGNASLFKGAPGIGYVLLRLAVPASLPSLLRLEAPPLPG